MALGLGIVLIIVGLILGLQIINFPAGFDKVISENGQQTLGWIFLVVGVLALVLSLYLNSQNNKRTTHVVEERRDDPRRER